MIATSLLTVLFLGSVVSSSPIVQIRDSLINIPLTRKLNATSLSIRNLLQHDQGRAQALRAQVGASVDLSLSSTATVIGNEPVDNQAVSYIASIGVGSPPTTCEYGGCYMY
jgi:cathepsin E